MNEENLLKAKQAIENLDLTMVANNMVKKLGWLQSEVDEACVLYRNFLFLNYKYPNEKIVPSEDVDEFWHNHILDTKKYKIDCENIFGSYLDHYPYFGMDGVSTIRDADSAFARTQELHKKEFGYFIGGVQLNKFCRLIRRFLRI
jgi:hypothetical protein